MSTADHHEPAHSPQGTGATMGPETQMLNLKILQNLAQNNIYRDEESKAGIRALEKSLLGQGRRYTPPRSRRMRRTSLRNRPAHLAQYGLPDDSQPLALLH